MGLARTSNFENSPEERTACVRAAKSLVQDPGRCCRPNALGTKDSFFRLQDAIKKLRKNWKLVPHPYPTPTPPLRSMWFSGQTKIQDSRLDAWSQKLYHHDCRRARFARTDPKFWVRTKLLKVEVQQWRLYGRQCQLHSAPAKTSCIQQQRKVCCVGGGWNITGEQAGRTEGLVQAAGRWPKRK